MKFVIFKDKARLLLSLPWKVPLESALTEFIQVFLSVQKWVRCVKIVLKNPLLIMLFITQARSCVMLLQCSSTVLEVTPIVPKTRTW